MLADGFLELRVGAVSGAEIHCEIITGGVLTSHKGINLPTGSILMPSMTDKDRDDLHFGLGLDVDYVALSFVRTAADIQDIKEIIRRENKHTPVIAKIEKHEAIDHYDDILDAASILAPTRSGRTAIHISRFRPKQPIIAFTPSQPTLRQLSLFSVGYTPA